MGKLKKQILKLLHFNFYFRLDESLILNPMDNYSRTNSVARSDDNSSVDGNSTSGIPTEAVSLKPETTIKVNAHVHDTDPSSLRTFQTLEASKLLKDQGFAGYITNDLLNDEGLIKMAKDDANFIRTMECSKGYFSKSSCLESDSKLEKNVNDRDFIKTVESSKFAMICNDNGQHGTIVKSTSSDTPLSMGAPVSSSELAAALLYASSNSLCNQGFKSRHRRMGAIEETDLSTPYNHYR